MMAGNSKAEEKDPLTHAAGLAGKYLRSRGLAFERQRAVDVVYKELVITGQRLDLLVEHALVVEIKSVSSDGTNVVVLPAF
jgi:hypothetical protein